MPRGLAASEATLATIRLGPIPMLQSRTGVPLYLAADAVGDRQERDRVQQLGSAEIEIRLIQ